MNIETAVIKTKIMVPRRRNEVLTRPRLLSIIEDIIDVKLLIVAAPAGYGKTSLLVDFAYHTHLPVCWFALDTLDSDPQRFIAHFISALQMRFPKFGKLALSAFGDLSQDNLNYDPIIAAIVNDAYENITEHFVFILDDYHLVRDNKQIEPFINRIVQEMAENCHFIIASRVLLTLPDLSLLVAHNQVAGLSFEELAFLSDEVKQLIMTNYHQTISDERAAELVLQTEGWITGLLLSTQLSPKGNEDRMRLAKVSGIGVYEYLAQQVFDRQPEDIQKFLLRTSLLDEFDAQLCTRVIGKALDLGRYPWHEKVEQILRDNLFVLSVGDETLFLRYHHLFRDFLQNRMRLEFPDETNKIELTLAHYYMEHNQWEQAYEIFKRLEEGKAVLQLIYEAGPFMINSGKLTTLSTWFEGVTEEQLLAAPELISIKATIASIRGDVDRSLLLLNQAIDGLRKSGKEIDLVRSLNRRSMVNNHLGRYKESLADADEAIALTERIGGLEFIRADAFRMRGLCQFQQGDLLGALDSLINSRNLFVSFGNKEDIAKVLMEMGLTQRRLGNFENAEKAYEDALDQWQSSGNSMWQANVLNNLGFLQNLRGQYEQAALSFERSLQYSRLAMYPRGEGFVLISLGDLYRDLRSYNEAHQAYQMAQSVAEATHDNSLHIYLAISQTTLHRIEKKFDEAAEQLSIAEKMAREGGSNYEMDLCRLENCFLLMARGITTNIDQELNYLSNTFERQSNLTETYRTNLLRVACRFMSSDWVHGESLLQEIHESRLREAAGNILVQIGQEFVDVFQKATQHLIGSGPLLDIIQRVHNFEQKAPEIRKILKRQNTVIQFTSYQITIRALGKMQVKVGDHILTTADWKSQTARDLFFYLLAQQGGVSKEEIGEVFWPDSTPEELRLRFKNTIYRLRRAVGNDAVTYEDDIYLFNRSVDYDYDVEHFQREISLAQSAGEIEMQIKHYKAALSMYQGPFLGKIDQSWVLSQREQFQRQFINGALKLANLLMQQGHHNSAIQYCKRVLDQDGCNEAAYRLMMLTYAAMEDRAAIKRTFETCRQTLLADLAVEPSETTRNLFDTLMI
jgi:ATP/maltotriose-dependent transcriptional regulator MalT/DNA-binding SARP family transcriptional activator